MRLALLLVIALSACASKKAAPKSPGTTQQAGSAATEATPTESAAPAPAPAGDDAPTTTTPKSDPEEGGQ